MNFDNRIESSCRDRDRPLSLQDFVALQLQDFSGLSRSGNRTLQLAGYTSNACHQFRITARQYAFAVVNIILEAHTHISSHRQGNHAQDQLMPPYSRYTPGTAGRKTARHMHEVCRVSANTTRHTHHEIKMHRVSYQAHSA